jgi:hypothetical protein
MPVQDTEHWRTYTEIACDIGLPMMLFVQVVQSELVPRLASICLHLPSKHYMTGL